MSGVDTYMWKLWSSFKEFLLSDADYEKRQESESRQKPAVDTIHLCIRIVHELRKVKSDESIITNRHNRRHNKHISYYNVKPPLKEFCQYDNNSPEIPGSRQFQDINKQQISPDTYDCRSKQIVQKTMHKNAKISKSYQDISITKQCSDVQTLKTAVLGVQRSMTGPDVKRNKIIERADVSQTSQMHATMTLSLTSRQTSERTLQEIRSGTSYTPEDVRTQEVYIDFDKSDSGNVANKHAEQSKPTRYTSSNQKDMRELIARNKLANTEKAKMNMKELTVPLVLPHCPHEKVRKENHQWAGMQLSSISEVSVQVENAVFCLKRSQLEANSQMFRQILNNNDKKTEGQIKLKGISIEAFCNILRWIYAGEVELSDANVMTILDGANNLGIHELVDKCLYFLEREQIKYQKAKSQQTLPYNNQNTGHYNRNGATTSIMN